jgi:hypothetical protein
MSELILRLIYVVNRLLEGERKRVGLIFPFRNTNKDAASSIDTAALQCWSKPRFPSELSLAALQDHFHSELIQQSDRRSESQQFGILEGSEALRDECILFERR